MFNRNNSPHELLLTTRQQAKLRNAFKNNMATDVKFSKAQISKVIQSGGYLGSLFIKLAGPLMKVVVPLAKNILTPLGTTAAVSAIDAGNQRKMHGSGATTLVTSNEQMKIVQALKDSLLKGGTKTIKNETKGQKGEFLGMLLAIFLGARLLGAMLTRKRMLRAAYGGKMDFNATSSFNKFWNKKVLSKWT